ncbi:MAG: flagellar motor protein MotB [Hyphomicrobiales bacterium]|nr:flagellar motor protein MotB [Hyphomicrobiales bacterium]MCP5373605.1 flagellar motor protein MotB [Hyphomicrobiales bacterium]
MQGDDELPPPAPPNMGWMVTFTDLVSLMLTFFVLLFSMSSVKIDRWEEMIDGLSQTLNPTREKTLVAATAKHNISTSFRKRAVNLDYLEAVLADTARGDDLLSRSAIVLLEDRLVMALPGDLLFEKGRAVLSEAARQALFHLGGILRNIDNQIAVSGHTDPIPIQSAEYRSNWELSLARGIAVVNALRRSGYTDQILAYGLADSRYADLPDLPEERKRALARRVDIVILPTVGS